MSILYAGFNIGDVIVHKEQKFRGVIIDVDADFQGTDDWYDQYTTNQPSKVAPWYHVLVDEEGSMAYVAEQNIYVDSTDMEVEHPMVDDIFTDYEPGHYLPKQTIN